MVWKICTLALSCSARRSSACCQSASAALAAAEFVGGRHHLENCDGLRQLAFLGEHVTVRNAPAVVGIAGHRPIGKRLSRS